MIQAGTLDTKIYIRKPVMKRADNGEFYQEGACDYHIWANRDDIDNVDNKEVEIGKQIVATGRTDFTIRYAKWLNERCEVHDPRTDTYFEILAISVQGRNHMQVIRARRKDNKRWEI